MRLWHSITQIHFDYLDVCYLFLGGSDCNMCPWHSITQIHSDYLDVCYLSLGGDRTVKCVRGIQLLKFILIIGVSGLSDIAGIRE